MINLKQRYEIAASKLRKMKLREASDSLRVPETTLWRALNKTQKKVKSDILFAMDNLNLLDIRIDKHKVGNAIGDRLSIFKANGLFIIGDRNCSGAELYELINKEITGGEI